MGTVLRAHKIRARMTPDGLHVSNPDAQGCGVGRPGAWQCGADHPSDLLILRSREDDGGRPWFYTSWGHAIAEAHQICNAVTALKSLLNGRPGVSL
ncbi:hypothetical protein [Actinomadura napierensis]|uniref:hypothetical protein n=1 Tax=Actinomadura napierensis TaxID=267854 RepID=UPI0031CDE724